MATPNPNWKPNLKLPSYLTLPPPSAPTFPGHKFGSGAQMTYILDDDSSDTGNVYVSLAANIRTLSRRWW